ncbi:DUF3445 domain-containing protein, partial [Rhizobium sp. TRM95111]|uniref:heme-dependent oxidative N-demethylase family protein n=1 Tax=Rhizobium alarense TaxID=2846851 RepID=UPI001F3DB527
ARWIEPDGDLERYLREKDRVRSAFPDVVFAEAPDTRAAQGEVLAMLADHLPLAHPSVYTRDGNAMRLPERRVVLDEPALPPLLRAGALVQEDLVLIRRRETGWHLAAGYVAFPSSWSLPEKFGRRMEEIHAPVPGFGEGTRNAMLINRMFDNLKPDQPVHRFNWSINPDADLHCPASKAHGALPGAPSVSLDETFVRVERQTLRRLPVSGDILFTIRIYADPIAAVGTLPDAATVAATFADQLEALEPAQARYKGLTEARGGLIAGLRALVTA